MFAAGFRRLYSIITTVINTQYGREYLPSNANAYIEFPVFELPTDELTDENAWSIKIKENRASIIDYLMNKHGLSLEEAILKAQEIQEYNQRFL